jgi:hypothetical protein
MGYIQQSNTKKIYAYLTQKGKQNFITGDTKDFQVAYFSLHDEDVNYKISAQLTSPSTYNTLKSGFISDITGDNDFCSPNISENILLKNKLIYFIPFEDEYLVEGVENFNTEEFEIRVYKNGLLGGYKFDVTIKTISFPNSNSTINEANVIKTEISETYTFEPITVGNTTYGYKKINLNATCKRIIKDNSGQNSIFCLLDDNFKARKADAFNFIVNVRDSTGVVVFTKTFDNINCSKSLYTITAIDFNDLPADFTHDYISPINMDDDIKMGFAIVKVDNGNRRSDLNMTQDDINYFYNSFGQDKPLENLILLKGDGVPDVKFPTNATSPGGFNTLPIPIDFDGRNLDPIYIYGNTSDNNLFSKQTTPAFIRTPLYLGDSWVDNAPNVISDQNFSNNWPLGYTAPASSLNFPRFSTFHPTVELFDDWKNGNTGFQMRLVEVSPYITGVTGLIGQNALYGANYTIQRILKHENNSNYGGILNISTLPTPNSNYIYQSQPDGTNNYIYGNTFLTFIGAEFKFAYCWLSSPIQATVCQDFLILPKATII